jgi:hypothetical protein
MKSLNDCLVARSEITCHLIVSLGGHYGARLSPRWCSQQNPDQSGSKLYGLAPIMNVEPSKEIIEVLLSALQWDMQQRRFLSHSCGVGQTPCPIRRAALTARQQPSLHYPTHWRHGNGDRDASADKQRDRVTLTQGQRQAAGCTR